MDELIFDVHWVGPLTVEDLKKSSGLTPEEIKNCVLYKIYGRHPLYGHNVLLYIGMTKQGVIKRIEQHNKNWFEQESDPCKVYVASIGKFKNWKKSNDIKTYKSPGKKTIKMVESLLIFAQAPAYNTRSKKSAKEAKNIRVFNTGRFGSLYPEISGLYYFDD